MQYVSFRLGKEMYALDVWQAREIVDAPALNQLPNAPAWLPGLMNLRGQVVPVVDLKEKFGLDAGTKQVGRGAYVIVVDLPRKEHDQVTIGVLADEVLEVFDLTPSEIGPPPAFGARYSRSYLLGMAKREGGIVALMDAPKVLSDTDVLVPAEAAAAP